MDESRTTSIAVDVEDQHVLDPYEQHRELVVIMMFRWGGMAFWRCLSCSLDNNDKRRSLQSWWDDAQEAPPNALEIFMSEELTLAIQSEVQAATSIFTEFGCFGSGKSIAVVFEELSSI